MTTEITHSHLLKDIISRAQLIAKDHQHGFYSPSHLMLASLQLDDHVKNLLELLDKDLPYLIEWAEVRIESYPKAPRAVSDPEPDVRTLAVLEEADLMKLRSTANESEAIYLMAAICKPNVAFTREQLKTLPLATDEIFDPQTPPAITVNPTGLTTPPVSSKTHQKNLNKFCVDKTALAREGKMDPIVGRDKETRMMIEILGRRTKPNVLIVGEPGVGKTALIEGFAQDINEKKVPKHLQNAILLELDLGALVAGASYKGEVEDRLKNIIREVKSFPKAILFIDEIHTMMDNQGPVGAGAANLLKPELARGEITVIGATTFDEYRKFLEPEEAFNRRFELLKIEEPDTDTAIRMVKTLVPLYEQHHSLQISPEAIDESVILAKRYIKDRRLPDAAIDLMDRTMAAIRMASETSEEEIKQLTQQLDLLVQKQPETLEAEISWFQQQMTNRISPILIGQLPEDQRKQELPQSPEKTAQILKETLEQLLILSREKKGQVNKTDIAAIISHKTGIPLGKIQAEERTKLLNMEEHLGQRVIGQPQAIKSLSEAILESRSGLTRPGQPIGSFFLLGPTGTGKTELSKALAAFLFNDESALIRFDMSEFKEEHSAALLYGAPPGYVGYKEGGLLVNKIREKPYAVLLFDEIEKAHASVFDVFLQILDEGKLHDRLGKEGDFSNAVILFTSNIGSQQILRQHEQGSLPSSSDLMEVMSGHFRPEFLARVTEIVPFAPISENSVTAIFHIHLNKLKNTLEKQGISLTLTEEAVQKLARSGFTPQYGARPLTGVIRNQLRRPISRMIISGQVGLGSTISLELDENQELLWQTTPPVTTEVAPS